VNLRTRHIESARSKRDRIFNSRRHASHTDTSPTSNPNQP
jgi:hypothetical protein